MRVEYQTTFDEGVDEVVRSIMRSKRVLCVLRKLMYRKGTLGLYVSLCLTPFLLIDGVTVSKCLVFIGVSTVLGFVGCCVLYRHRLRKELFNELMKLKDVEGFEQFIVDLRDNCIWAKDGDREYLFDWGDIKTVYYSYTMIELRMKDGTLLAVRKRGFSRAEEWKKFKKIIKDRMKSNVGK